MVLNASYEPLKIVCWQKAILLWFQGKAEIIEHHDIFVRSVRTSFRLPSVLRLTAYVQIRTGLRVRFSRENVYTRDGYKCQYCATSFSQRDLTLDHVIPLSRGGRKEWHNIVTACRECNQVKGNRTPQEASMPLLKAPSIPRWLPQPDLRVNVELAPEVWREWLNNSAG